jgi:hypothetical protein
MTEKQLPPRSNSQMENMVNLGNSYQLSIDEGEKKLLMATTDLRNNIKVRV